MAEVDWGSGVYMYSGVWRKKEGREILVGIYV